MKVTRKFVCSLTAIVLAAGLVPAPAFAAAGDGLVAAGGLSPLALPVPSDADYTWYADDPDADSFTVSTLKQLVAFANLVNGKAPASIAPSSGVSFEGKKVSVALKGVNLGDFKDGKWTPIGDESHPFEGEFDGRGLVFNNFAVVNSAGRSAYFGFFGYVGSKGYIHDVKVTNTNVNAKFEISRAKSSKDVIHHVGGVAGYCGGKMANCENYAPITVTSEVAQTAANHQVVWAVGGVAGECAGDMTGCKNAGGIAVKATAVAVTSIDDSGLVRYVGGVAGVSGDSSQIGTVKEPVAATAASHGSMTGCANEAKVSVDTPSTAGKDRFGETVFSRGVCIGGVVGYARGSVSACANGRLDSPAGSDAGYVRAEHGSQVGGIAGSLRATPSASVNRDGRVEADDGCVGVKLGSGGADVIAVSGCANYGDVYALDAAGGIVGSAGSYTTVTGCVNSLKQPAGQTGTAPTFVIATRWNKPAPSGIVGVTSGDVSYCANFADVASGTWKDEAARTLENSSGYYASGLVGMALYFSKVLDGGSVERTSPLPEVYGCYNAGKVSALSGFRQRGLVGENSGSVHDNVLRRGMVERDLLVYDEGSIGTAERNQVLDDDALRGKGAVAALNSLCDSEEWKGAHWVLSVAGETKNPALNLGFPVLSGANPVSRDDRIDLSGFEVELADAAYTGGTGGSAAIPAATVKDAAGNELVQGADFRVVPQAGAIEISSGKPYEASVVGIGRYRGEKTAEYDIKLGRIADCTVTVESATFDYSGHYPFKDGADGPGKVTVKTPGGVVVDPGEYQISEVVRKAAGKVAETFTPDCQPVNASNYYYVSVKANPDSTHFSTDEGTTAEPKSANYRIAAADLQQDVKYDDVKITWNKKSYAWVSSDKEQNQAKPKTKLAYTGSPIKPTVSGLTYMGHKLVEGKDYRVLYGNPNPVSTGGDSYDTNNIGRQDGKGVGCISVKFQSGSAASGNFTNYQNMFFAIENGNMGSLSVSAIADQKYTGKAIKAVPTVKASVKSGSKTVTKALKNGTDFTASWKNNVKVGTATAILKGKGKYSGVRTVAFKIKKANPVVVKAKSPAVSAGQAAKRNLSIAAKNAVAVSKAQGKVTYKKTGGNAKIAVSSAGAMTVKKGIKKGTYPVKVAVTAAGNGSYLKATKTVTVNVRVV